jgi:putative ABC transport system permease protein
VTPTIDLSLGEVVAALALVAVALVVSRWQRADLEADIGVAVLRSFVQLTAVGFVIQAIFDADRLVLAAVLVAGMVVFGAFTARGRAAQVPGALGLLLIALGGTAAATLGLAVGLGVIGPEPRYVVPLGGMVVGNAMNAAAVALNRLGDEIGSSEARIEATLALGATTAQAVRPMLRRSLRSGMIPLIDSTKTTGVVFFPGAMVGMLLAGASPADAVRLQLVIMYLLLGGVSLSAVFAVMLAYRRFFTPAHQLRERGE